MATYFSAGCLCACKDDVLIEGEGTCTRLSSAFIAAAAGVACLAFELIGGAVIARQRLGSVAAGGEIQFLDRACVGVAFVLVFADHATCHLGRGEPASAG